MVNATHRARAVAAAAVDFLIARPEDLAAMLTETGAAPAEAAALLESEDGAAAALAFVARDEARAEAFCIEAKLTPEVFAAVRAELSGEGPHWT